MDNYPIFSKDEARAILSLVIDMVVVDSDVDVQEQLYVTIAAHRFGLDELDIRKAQTLSPHFVANTVGSMSYEKRKIASCLVFLASIADAKIANAERRLFDMLARNCNFVDIGDEDAGEIVYNWLNNK